MLSLQSSVIRFSRSEIWFRESDREIGPRCQTQALAFQRLQEIQEVMGESLSLSIKQRAAVLESPFKAPAASGGAKGKTPSKQSGMTWAQTRALVFESPARAPLGTLPGNALAGGAAAVTPGKSVLQKWPHAEAVAQKGKGAPPPKKEMTPCKDEQRPDDDGETAQVPASAAGEEPGAADAPVTSMKEKAEMPSEKTDDDKAEIAAALEEVIPEVGSIERNAEPDAAEKVLPETAEGDEDLWEDSREEGESPAESPAPDGTASEGVNASLDAASKAIEFLDAFGSPMRECVLAPAPQPEQVGEEVRPLDAETRAFLEQFVAGVMRGVVHNVAQYFSEDDTADPAEVIAELEAHTAEEVMDSAEDCPDAPSEPVEDTPTKPASESSAEGGADAVAPGAEESSMPTEQPEALPSPAPAVNNEAEMRAASQPPAGPNSAGPDEATRAQLAALQGEHAVVAGRCERLEAELKAARAELRAFATKEQMAELAGMLRAIERRATAAAEKKEQGKCRAAGCVIS